MPRRGASYEYGRDRESVTKNFDSKQAYMDYLKGDWNVDFTEETVKNFLDTYAPGTEITPPEDPKRQERRKLMLKAREKWAEALANGKLDPAFTVPYADNGNHMDRAAKLLEPLHSLGSEERNREAIEILSGNDKEAKTRLAIERLSWAYAKIQEFSAMTDEELVEHMPEALYAGELLFTADSACRDRNSFNLEGPLGDLVNKAKDVQQHGSSLRGRFFFMQSPLYEMLDSKVEDNLNAEKLFADKHNIKSELLQEYAEGIGIVKFMLGGEKIPDVRITPEISAAAKRAEEKRIASTEAARGKTAAAAASRGEFSRTETARKRADYLQDYFTRNYSKPEQFTLLNAMDGKKIGTGAQVDAKALMENIPLVLIEPDGNMKTLTLKSKTTDVRGNVQNTFHLESAGDIELLFLRDDAKKLEKLEKGLKDADPWYIQSSDNFKRLQAAIKSVKEEFQTGRLSKKENKNMFFKSHRDALRAQMQGLYDAAATYLKRYDDKEAEGKTPYKNGRERERYLAALEIRGFAEDRLNALDKTERALEETCRDARRDRLEGAEPYLPYAPDRQYAMEAAKNPVKASFAAAEAQNQPQKANPKKQVSASFAPRPELSKRLAGDFGREKAFLPNSEARRLCEKVDKYLCNKGEIDALYKKTAFTPQEAGDARRRMAEMVAVELLRQERKGELNGLENELDKMRGRAFVDCIEKIPAFREKMKEVTPQSFSRFIAGRGDRGIANEMQKSILRVQDKAVEKAGKAAEQKPSQNAVKNGEAAGRKTNPKAAENSGKKKGPVM